MLLATISQPDSPPSIHLRRSQPKENKLNSPLPGPTCGAARLSRAEPTNIPVQLYTCVIAVNTGQPAQGKPPSPSQASQYQGEHGSAPTVGISKARSDPATSSSDMCFPFRRKGENDCHSGQSASMTTEARSQIIAQPARSCDIYLSACGPPRSDS